jgi:hypothetical protein
MLNNWRSPGLITIAGLAVGVGLLPLPFEYFVLLRLFLCGVCLYYLSSLPKVRDGEKWVLAGLAVYYNPLVPVTLGGKTLWSLVSIATVIWFWALDRRAKRARDWSIR